METESVSRVSDDGHQHADVIVEVAGRLFFSPGFTAVSTDDVAREPGMSKKAIHRRFPHRRGQSAAVPDRQFAAVEGTLVAAAEGAEGQPVDVRVQRFLIAAGTELGRIGAARLAIGRGGDATPRQYVEQRVDAVIHRRIDELFRHGHRQGLPPGPPELLSEITRGAPDRVFTPPLSPHEPGWTAADLPRTTIDTVPHGAIRPTRTGIDDERLGSVIRAARDDDKEVSP
ncbi:TetR/AcrR family transcriptional regulator [Streptomyces fagopyri]|uniref:TetR/AcrR family transcriptional regulator n=1 Tax=Streptomyces fagopyri TaxID=2662397 RepID=UPI003724AA93